MGTTAAPTTVPVATPTPATVTSVLESIWDDEGEKIAVAALAVSGPVGAAIAYVLNIPVVGALLTSWLNSLVNSLIAAGIIDIKIGIIQYLSAAAQAKWAPQLQILQQVQSSGGVLTADQQAAYDAALQSLVENHPVVVNA